MLLRLALNLWPHTSAHCGMTGMHCQLGWFLQIEGYLECVFESEQLSHQGLFA